MQHLDLIPCWELFCSFIRAPGTHLKQGTQRSTVKGLSLWEGVGSGGLQNLSGGLHGKPASEGWITRWKCCDFSAFSLIVIVGHMGLGSFPLLMCKLLQVMGENLLGSTYPLEHRGGAHRNEDIAVMHPPPTHTHKCIPLLSLSSGEWWWGSSMVWESHLSSSCAPTSLHHTKELLHWSPLVGVSGS